MMTASAEPSIMEPQRLPLTVYLVDDDPAIRDALSLSLSLGGYQIAQFASAEDFFSAFEPHWLGCVVADIRMPGMSGLQLQAKLAELGANLPVIIITGHGDVTSARTAFRGKAVDFLEKPFDNEQLTNAIETAFEHVRRRMMQQVGEARRAALFSSLTPREHEVMAHLVKGLHAKEIGEQMGISHRTVEVHKAHIMEKLGVRSVIDIVRLTERTTDADTLGRDTVL